MIATLVLIAGGVILVFASGWSPAAILVGGLLLVVAGWRILDAGRHDQTPVSRSELANPHRLTLKRYKRRWWCSCNCGAAWGDFRTRRRARAEWRRHAEAWHEAHAPDWMYRR